MSEKDSNGTERNTKPPDISSPVSSKKSSSPMTATGETLEEVADRVTRMIIENLNNPACHSAYRPYPYPVKK